LRSALDHGGPTVIDAVVDRAEVPPALARRAAHVRAMSGR
jgi:thiamine pyrophosphate-dependent acetolactate synthase large subunit-like protein